MKVVESSLSYRVARPAWLWLRKAARDSLVGRFFLALPAALGPSFADSRVFGTRHEGSRRLGRSDHPLSVLAISWPYLWLRDKIGGGAFGRVVKAGEAGFAGSQFAGGRWVLAVGAGLFALGCGRLALLLVRGVATVEDSGLALATPWLRLVTPIITLVVGAVLLASGSRLVSAFRTSVAGRGFNLATGYRPRGLGSPVRIGRTTGVAPADVGERPGFWRRMGGPVGMATVFAAVAGAIAGLTPGSGALILVACVVAVGLLALALCRPEIMLVAVAAFPWLDWAARRTLGGFGPAWDDALLVFAVVLLLWGVIVLRRWELWTVPTVLPTLLALAAAIGSVVVRDVPGDVALFALRVLFQPLLFYFLGYLFPKTKHWVRGTVAVFILGSVALALHGLYQYVTHAPMPARWIDVHETDISTRAYSIIENPNGLGAFLLLGTLVSLSLALSRGFRRGPRLALAAACAIQLGGLAVTFSRGAWIGLAVGVLALLIMAYRRFLAPLAAAAVVGWFVVPQTFINRLTFAFSSTYLVKSMAAGRLYVWKMSLQHIAAHPWFGVGLGTFGGTSAVTFGYGRLWVDNFYLQLAAEGGLLLLAFFLWILLRAAKGLVKGYVATRDPFTRALNAGVFGAFVAVAAANVTASVWETLVVGVGFWFLTGLATSAAQLEAAAEPEATPTSSSAAGMEAR